MRRASTSPGDGPKASTVGALLPDTPFRGERDLQAVDFDGGTGHFSLQAWKLRVRAWAGV